MQILTDYDCTRYNPSELGRDEAWERRAVEAYADLASRYVLHR